MFTTATNPAREHALGMYPHLICLPAGMLSVSAYPRAALSPSFSLSRVPWLAMAVNCTYLPFLPRSVKFAFSFDVSIPLDILFKADVYGSDKITLEIVCDGGLVMLDLASKGGQGSAVTLKKPSFKGTKFVGGGGAVGSAAASLGIEIDAHLEVGLGFMGSIFATAHAQAQWAQGWLRLPNGRTHLHRREGHLCVWHYTMPH